MKKLQENARAKLLTTSNVLCKQCFKKNRAKNFLQNHPFFNLDLQKTRIFLKTHTKRLMFHYQLVYSVQLAFFVLESIFDDGVFPKNLIFCYLKKMVFLQKILGSIFLQTMFS